MQHKRGERGVKRKRGLIEETLLKNMKRKKIGRGDRGNIVDSDHEEVTEEELRKKTWQPADGNHCVEVLTVDRPPRQRSSFLFSVLLLWGVCNEVRISTKYKVKDTQARVKHTTSMTRAAAGNLMCPGRCDIEIKRQSRQSKRAAPLCTIDCYHKPQEPVATPGAEGAGMERESTRGGCL